ncbi:MAG: hypothetical protein QXK83_07345 [Zestosphaera sp.]
MSVVRKVPELVRVFSSLLFRAVFIYGDIEGRHVPLLLNLTLLAAQILAVRGGVLHTLIALASAVLTYMVRGSTRAIKYAAVLASIPAAWYLIMSLPFTMSIQSSALISLRVLTVSLSFLCFFYFLNPVEVSTLLKVLGLRSASLYPALTWRVVPHIMRDAETALLVGSMKGVETWRSLAISIVTTEEYVSLYEEGIHTKPAYNPSFTYNPRHTAITLALLAVLIAANVLITL